MNALALFFLANLVLGIFFSFRDRWANTDPRPRKPKTVSKNGLFYEDGSPVNNGKRNDYQLQWFDFNGCEDIDPKYVADVLDAFWALGNRGYVYQPWVGYAEPPFSSKLVNVDSDAFGFPVRRTINQQSDDTLPTVRIWAMGGSPTFGYQVSDEHTWPSQLSKILTKKARGDHLGVNIEVVNYGRASFYPSQETALLIDLLRSGQRPNLVIFMDGVTLGSSDDVPMFSPDMAREMHRMQFPPPLTEELNWVPIVRLANDLRHKLSHTSDTQPTHSRKRPSQFQRIDNLVNMFKQNQEISAAISELYGVRTLFFLQPNAAYNYSPELFRRGLPDSFITREAEIRSLYQRLQAEKAPRARIDLSRLFEAWGKRKAIIDDYHYSPRFSEFLAQHVADHIDLKSLVRQSSIIGQSSATAAPSELWFQ